MYAVVHLSELYKDLLCARLCLDARDIAVIQADTSSLYGKGDRQETNKQSIYRFSKCYKGNKWDGIKIINWEDRKTNGKEK